MKFNALNISIGDQHAGILFQYGKLIRFQIDPAYANNRQRRLLSLSMLAETPEEQVAFLLNPIEAIFNSPDGKRLPPFFQNLLPEGVLRKHIAAERKCDEDDHFELLAAVGADLPGDVHASPVRNPRDVARDLVTQNQDALEESVVADPIEDAVSLSGVQPKLALIKDGGRFVAGRKVEGRHIIGKLPTAQHDLLPEVEHLSLQLAKAAGVTVCVATLEPLTLIDAEHAYALGQSNQFLAVERFDRDRPGRLHAEDFAQILSVDPDNKYTGGTYAGIARAMLAVEGLGMPAVHELMRRIAVSELIGNYDFHLKNIGVLHHPDGRVELSPAYDVVAYGVYLNGRGHALRFAPDQVKRQELTPETLHAFTNEAGIVEAPLRKTISDVCARALDMWPRMIAESQLRDDQKKRLLDFMMSRAMMQSFVRRRK